MANKTTKREVLAIIKSAMADNEAVVAYCDNEVALLDKKNVYRKTHPAKPTKAQEAAEALKPVVLEAMKAEGQTSKNIADVIGEPSFQKITPILLKLVEAGSIRTYSEKGKTYYALPEAEAEVGE